MRNDETVELKLLTRPLEFRMQERDRFEIGLTATNRGKRAVDPELGSVQLLVNGENSLVWADAIQNGYRDGNWFALPPGESVSMTWPRMGEALFQQPGLYRLQLRLGNNESVAVNVKVLGTSM
jgi:hypothetical protein